MPFNPEKDIPDLSGKIILVTGGSSGLGKESVHQLAKHHPERIFLGARTAKRGNAAIEGVEAAVPAMKGKITYLEMDLSSFTSLKKAAETLRSQTDRLDVLMNNAGLMAQPVGLTEDGYEVQFGANYMGPALFTRLLLPLLQSTAEKAGSDVRVVNLSSELGIRSSPKEGIILSRVKTDLADMGSVTRYGQSKLADYYHTKSLARQHPEIKFVAIHPGVVNTGLFDDLKKRRPYFGGALVALGGVFLTNVHQGARAQLWASAAPKDRVRSGGFYNSSLKEYDNAILKDEKLAQELEDWTEEEFRSKGF